MIIYRGKNYDKLTDLVFDAIEEGRLQGEKERSELRAEVERLKSPGTLPQMDAEGRVKSVCNKCGAEGRQEVTS